MDSARGWFQKFHPSTRRTESTTMGTEDLKSLSDEEASTVTMQKVAAAKQYIENHYKEQMKSLQERKERYVSHALYEKITVGLPRGEAVPPYLQAPRAGLALSGHPLKVELCAHWTGLTL
ncbi:non-specific serine,threonine protein kinase, partial [Sarracenia purpurea var. burkii]